MKNFRFVLRDGEFGWRHTSEVLATDVDCTDMTDIEFELKVREVTP